MPLHFCQVLEDEYEQIHNETPPGRSWLFAQDHVKDRYEFFITELQNAKDPLSIYLREKLLLSLDKRGPENLGALGLSVQQIIDFLNDELISNQLYDEQRFKRVILSETTRKLIALGVGKDFLSHFIGQDLVHFNRLLLEDAYPDHFKRIHEIRLDNIYSLIHEKRGQNAALCLSGGGIRSGTFALGILQGLARKGLLDKFNYLSTVSGGGYIGSWLSAWIYRNRQDMEGVITALKNEPPPSKLQPEPSPIQYLREYSHFLTPRYSLLSADVWTFVAIYLRNLLLNWTVFIPLLICVLTLPRLFLSVLAQPPASYDPSILFLLGVVFAAISIGYIRINRPSMGDALYAKSRFWRRRTDQGSFLICCLLTLSISAVLVTVAWAWTTHDGRAASITSRASFLLGWLHYVPALSYVPAWLSSFGWAYLFTLSSYLIGVILTVSILRRLGLLIRDIPFSALVLAPLSAIFLSVMTTEVFPDPLSSGLTTGRYTVFGPPLYLLVWLLSVTIVVGITSRNYSHSERARMRRALFPRDEDHEWYARLGGWLLIAIIVWMLLTTLVIFGPVLLTSWFWPYVVSLGSGSGIFAALAGHSSKTPATEEKNSSQSGKSLVSTVLSLVTPYILTLASLIFIMFLIAGLSLVTGLVLSLSFPNTVTGYVEIADIAKATPWQVFLVLLVAFGCAFLAALFINLSKFSLHGSYRTRLIRTYLGASRSKVERRPNRFTGFDPADNIQMDELRPELLHERDFTKLPEFVRELRRALTDPTDNVAEAFKRYAKLLNSATQDLLRNHDDTNLPSPSLKVALITDLNSILENKYLYGENGAGGSPATRPDTTKNREKLDGDFSGYIQKYERRPYRLFHVINMTLNLFHGENLAWQQRKAESFTTSALHSGCFHLGYRETKHYGGPEGLSLGTAATTSGAAVNSNMGNYFSSSLVSFVLTFFNARLGLWLGNPGVAGDSSYQLAYPKLSVLPIISEAFGFTDNRSRFVNLSDGGHFENLGLYEMVLRRCNFIIVADGGEDAKCKFDDLGNAVRKIRIDLGIPIEFQQIPIYPRDHKDHEDGSYWAIARIKYSRVDLSSEDRDGLLLYIKPAFYGSEPSDIYNYAVTHDSFPHQTTANQFFNESQFESYRMLGSYIIDLMWPNNTNPASLSDFAWSAYRQSKGKKPSVDFESWFNKWL